MQCSTVSRRKHQKNARSMYQTTRVVIHVVLLYLSMTYLLSFFFLPIARVQRILISGLMLPLLSAGRRAPVPRMRGQSKFVNPPTLTKLHQSFHQTWPIFTSLAAQPFLFKANQVMTSRPAQQQSKQKMASDVEPNPWNSAVTEAVLFLKYTSFLMFFWLRVLIEPLLIELKRRYH